MATPKLEIQAGGYQSGLNDPNRWYPSMPCPWPTERIARFQKQIDALTGTRDGKPIVRLRWAPEVFEWWPVEFGEKARGYVFPTYIALWDKHGNAVSAPRWVLEERDEPEHFVSGWEDNRWIPYADEDDMRSAKLTGEMIAPRIYDAKGPCPNERYTPCYKHPAHPPKVFDCCATQGGQDNCWAFYMEPDAVMLMWVAERARAGQQDSDVNPLVPAERFTAPKGQLATKNRLEGRRSAIKSIEDAAEKEAKDFLTRSPYSVSGFRKESGLYVPDN